MSGFYIGADGKTRKIKGGYVGIDGIARKIKKGYIGDVNGTARLCYSGNVIDPVFANNTWENVIAACKNNAVPDTWEVGDQLTMSIDGTDYAIDIIGKNHDDYADGSGKAPLTFQLHNNYENAYSMNSVNNNNGGWASSNMRNTTLPTLFALMPTVVQNAIKKVNKATSVGGGNSAIAISEDTLFLLSEVEVLGSCPASYEGEGIQYAYYIGNADTSKQNINGVTLNWWTRSPAENNTSSYRIISDGGKSYNGSPTNTMGVSFAFCF